MKIYLDDQREPPIGWLLVRDFETMIELIESDAWSLVTHVSLDHDLGNVRGRDGTAVANAIEARYHRDGVVPELTIHSANPVGCMKMQAAFDAIDEHRSNM